MTTDNQPEPAAPPRVIYPVRWAKEDFEKLERAAVVWKERDNLLRMTVADVIRAGAIRQAEEILAATVEK